MQLEEVINFATNDIKLNKIEIMTKCKYTRKV